MSYVIRFSVKRKSEQRKLGTRTYLDDKGRVMTHALGNGRLFSKQQAAKFATREAAVSRLCEYIENSNWPSHMWVKNPQIEEIRD